MNFDFLLVFLQYITILEREIYFYYDQSFRGESPSSE